MRQRPARSLDAEIGSKEYLREVMIAKRQAMIVAMTAVAIVAVAAAGYSSLRRHYRSVIEVSATDPDSLVYRDDHLRWADDHFLYCGEVNAKNRFGGYAGYRLFIVERGEVNFSPSHTADLINNTLQGRIDALEAKIDFLRMYQRKCDLDLTALPLEPKSGSLASPQGSQLPGAS